MKLGSILLCVAFVAVVKGQSDEWQRPIAPLQIDESNSFKYAHRASRNSLLGNHVQADLPDIIVPQSYKIDIRPFLENDTYGTEWTADGHVEIAILPLVSTNVIVFHRHPSLIIDETTVNITGPTIVTVAGHSYDEANHFHTIELQENLKDKYTYVLSITYQAQVQASTSGLYRGFHKDDSGKEHRFATTQFESIGARQAFPCFDEPRWKTPFSISIGYTSKYITLSNSVVYETRPDPNVKYTDWFWDDYERTVKMPTYLVAIIVSSFDYIEACVKDFGERPVRIYGEKRYIAPGGDKSVGGGVYAADASAKLIAFLEKKYNYTYEMPKMDSVAIPDPYFAAGAMENWGLNTYREKYLLHFDKEQKWSDKQSITSVLSHELAHQWFGNLVTCKTWKDIWLNEGFATYVADVGVENTHPEWRELTERLYGNMQNALNQDVTSTAPVYSSGAPSVIIYDKGGSLIRMMEGFLGEETLTKALVSYLQAKAYDVAVQDELFEHLTAHAGEKIPKGKTMKEIMDTWTLQPGFPLIRVSKVGPKNLYISQERFIPSPTTDEEASEPQQIQTYEVPIAIATADSTVFSNHTPALWLTQETISTSYAHDTSKWILLNPDAMAYYRVLYDDVMLQLILDEIQINRNSISELSRSQLIDDYFNFAIHGHLPITKALDVTKILQNAAGIEEEFIVWYPLFKHLTQTSSLFYAHNGGATHSLRAYLMPKLELALDKFGFVQDPDDKGNKVVFRAKLLDWACALDSPVCVATAKDLVNQWILDETKVIPVDVQETMFCSAVANGNQKVFEEVLTRLEAAERGTFKTLSSKLLKAASCSKDEGNLNRTLALAIDSTKKHVKNADEALFLIQRVAENPHGRPLIINFLNENFQDVVGLKGINTVTSILSTYCSLLTKEVDRDELEEFLKVKETALKPVTGAVENAKKLFENNLKWIETNYKKMDDWFINASLP